MTIMRKNDNPKSIMRNENKNGHGFTKNKYVWSILFIAIQNVFLLYLNDFRGIMGVVVF